MKYSDECERATTTIFEPGSNIDIRGEEVADVPGVKYSQDKEISLKMRKTSKTNRECIQVIKYR